MTIKEHVTEPWGIVAALVLGGMGAAVAAALGPPTITAALAGSVIAIAVYGTKVGLAIVADRPWSRPRGGVPADARAWLARAAATVDELDRHDRHGTRGAHRLPDGATRRARGIVDRLSQRAGALAVVDAQMAGTDAGALHRERERLEGVIAGTAKASALRAEREISLRAVRARISAHEAQIGIRELLLANMESTVLRLEAAAAQASLLTSRRAVAETSGEPADELTTLTDELEAARLGLEETEELTRRVLGEA